MNELVSVIIPTHGGGQYLERAVDSVLLQTYRNIELIVVDDNGVGTPGQLSTAAIMSKYKGDPRVKYICHETNKNGSAARNTGFRNSRGLFIALLDDDDDYLPEKIERQVMDIRQLDENYALVYCGHEVFDSNGRSLEVKMKTQSGSLFYEVMMHNVVIGSDSMLIRRKVYEELGGFDETFRRHQDYEFTARAAYKYKVYAEKFIGFNYNLLFRNSPKNVDQAVEYRKYFLDKMKPYYENLPRNMQTNVVLKNLLGLCYQYLKQGKIVKSIKLYNSLHPGREGIVYVLRRALQHLKNKR